MTQYDDYSLMTTSKPKLLHPRCARKIEALNDLQVSWAEAQRYFPPIVLAIYIDNDDHSCEECHQHWQVTTIVVKNAVLGQDKKSFSSEPVWRKGRELKYGNLVFWPPSFLSLSLSTPRLPLPVSCYKTGCSKLHEDPAEPVSSTPFGFLPL